MRSWQRRRDRLTGTGKPASQAQYVNTAPSASATTASVPGSGLIGTVVSLTIFVNDTNGRARDHNDDSALLSVVVTGANAATLTISNGPANTYSASYNPAAAGTDTITIKLSGTNISGSPFTCVITNPTPPPSNRCLTGDYVQPSAPASLRTRYTSATGAGAHDGTLGNEWTLIEAETGRLPGDLIYMTGDYGAGSYIKVTSNGGTSANWITYKRKAGDASQPIIRGVDVNEYCFFVSGQSYIRVEDITINTTTNNAPSAQWRNAHHIQLINCTISGNHVGIGDSVNGAHDCWVEGCTFDNIGSIPSNTGDGVFIQSGTGGTTSDNNTIVRNTFLKCGHACASIGGYQNAIEGDCTGNVFAQNTCNNIWAGGVIFLGKSVNGVAECNDIFGCGTANLGSPGTQNGFDLACRSGVFRYNRIWNCDSDGILLQSLRFGGFVEVCTNNHVYQNTIFDVGRGAVTFVISNVDSSNHGSNLIENNVCWKGQRNGANNGGGWDSGTYYMVWIDQFNSTALWPALSLNGNIVRNNVLARSASNSDSWALYIRTPTAGGNLAYTLSAFQATFANCASNTEKTDPLFVAEAFGGSTPDLHLQAGSPLIDAGRIIPGVNYLGAAPDIGAYEKA